MFDDCNVDHKTLWDQLRHKKEDSKNYFKFVVTTNKSMGCRLKKFPRH